MGVQVAKGQLLQLGESVPAQVPDGAVGDAVGQKIHDPLGYRHAPGAQADAQQGPGHQGKVDLPDSQHGVNGLTHQNGDIQGQPHVDETQQQGYHDGGPVGADIA